jgi:hypothetical protein
MVRRELAALLGLAVAASAGREHHGARVDLELIAVLAAAGCAPAVLGSIERDQRAVRQRLSARGDVGVAKPGRDRVTGAVADLQKPLAGRAAAAGEAIAAVLARELDTVLLEPVDRGRRLFGEHLDEPAVGRLVRALPYILRVLLRRVVVAERSLNPTLRLRGVAGLERALGHERDARTGPLG